MDKHHWNLPYPHEVLLGIWGIVLPDFGTNIGGERTYKDRWRWIEWGRMKRRIRYLNPTVTPESFPASYGIYLWFLVNDFRPIIFFFLSLSIHLILPVSSIFMFSKSVILLKVHLYWLLSLILLPNSLFHFIFKIV